jgi:hypothetical protein
MDISERIEAITKRAVGAALFEIDRMTGSATLKSAGPCGDKLAGELDKLISSALEAHFERGHSMFELIMTFCLAGQPCAEELVATFPQWDVGREVCEMGKPGIEMGIRAKLRPNVTATFACRAELPVPAQSIQPRGNVSFAKEQPLDVMGLLQKVLPK